MGRADGLKFGIWGARPSRRRKFGTKPCDMSNFSCGPRRVEARGLQMATWVIVHLTPAAWGHAAYIRLEFMMGKRGVAGGAPRRT